jgi:hypothetical protein
MKTAAAVSIQTDDLAIEHSAMRAHGVRDLFCEVRPTLERVAVARDELAVVAGHVRQRAEAVELHLVQSIGVIERLRDTEQAHGAQRGRIRETQAVRIP